MRLTQRQSDLVRGFGKYFVYVAAGVGTGIVFTVGIGLFALWLRSVQP